MTKQELDTIENSIFWMRELIEEIVPHVPHDSINVYSGRIARILFEADTALKIINKEKN